MLGGNMLIFLFLQCCCQSSFALQSDDSRIIQGLAERIALLELNQVQQKMGASHNNDPLSNISERNEVNSETYRNFENKIRTLEEKLLDHEKVTIQLKDSKDKIDTLEKTVHDLSIAMSQQRKEIKCARGLETKVADQGRTISDLRKRTFDCERIIFNFQNQLDMFLHSEKFRKQVVDPLEKSRAENEEEDKYRSIRSVRHEMREFHSQQKRLLSPVATTPPSLTNHTIAFYAYMGLDTQAFTIQHTLTFDVVKTNIGYGYHPATGVFIVPESGVYVFTWSIRENGNDHHSTELIVNTDVFGDLYVHADSHSSTGTGVVVTHVNAGDDVFIRTTSYVPHHAGAVGSNDAGRSSFAGWKLC